MFFFVEGEVLIFKDDKAQWWPVPRNVKLTLSYSSGDVTRTVSYIEITAFQDSQLGRAYITRGGIGDTFLSVVIEANSTRAFNYRAYFYGY